MWASGLRRGGQAAVPKPRRLRILNTHTYWRTPANPLTRRSRNRSSFISKGEIPFARAPLSCDQRDIHRGQLRHELPQTHRATTSSPPAHATKQTRTSSRSPASSPRQGRCHPAPHSFAAWQHQLPAAAPPRSSDLPCSACRVRAGGGSSSRRRRSREAPATPCHAASRDSAGRRERTGGGGRRQGGRRRGRGAKVQASLGSAAPGSPHRSAPCDP